MHNDIDCLPEIEEKINDNILDRHELHDVTLLAAELKRLLVRHHDALKEGGINKEMKQLENWLETERKGSAPAGVISESGLLWLTALRDKLKLSADELQRLEAEGGNPPPNHDQAQKTEELLKTIRRIDRIISEATTVKPN